MTRAFDYVNGDLTANPLYTKLRNKFIYSNNCTIGEVMLQRAANDGYRCSAAVTSDVHKISSFRVTSEKFITTGNSLPIEEKLEENAKSKKHLRGIVGMLALLAVFACVAVYLVNATVKLVKENIEEEQAITEVYNDKLQVLSANQE